MTCDESLLNMRSVRGKEGRERQIEAEDEGGENEVEEAGGREGEQVKCPGLMAHCGCFAVQTWPRASTVRLLVNVQLAP